MLCRIEVSEDVDVNREVHLTNVLFVTVGIFQTKSRFQTAFCNEWHDVLLMSTNPKQYCYLNTEIVDQHCIIDGFSKSEAIKLFKNGYLREKSRI